MDALVDFAGTDYLGLARDPRMVEALCRAAREDRISATSSRWGLGWTEHHARLERGLAEFFEAGAACILGSAYLGGLVYFTTIADPSRDDRCDTVFCDANSHSNLLEGMRAAGMTTHTFAHLDPGDLHRQLAAHRGGRAVVATDGAYGISGELADLAALHDVAREFDAEFLVDDAHGVFCMGTNGRGGLEECGVRFDDRTTLAGSMSKALGVGGGFLVGRTELVERFRKSAAVSGSSHPPIPLAAACNEGLRIVREEPALLARLRDRTRRMHDILAHAGIPIVSDRTPIVAMTLADEFEAARLGEHFLRQGLRIPYFKYASEPRHNLLRAVARACYTESDLEKFAAAIRTWKG